MYEFRTASPVILVRFLLLSLVSAWPFAARAGDAENPGIDTVINTAMQPVADAIAKLVFFAVPVN
ncbi:MAG: hypothetical protein HQ511_13835, partial [Rhodospirillales bacterium]|nr:hypothetical protein [Rhodospirillales bacterium]